MATRSNSPVTEYTSETSGIWAIASAVSGMRVTSAFTRTIAVTTAASSALRTPAAPAARVAYIPAWVRRGSAADPGERAHAGQGEPAEQALQHVGGGPGVGQGPMTRPGPGAEETGESGQLAVGYLGITKHRPSQRRGVENRERGPGKAAVVARRGEKTNVEGRVVRGQHAAASEGEETRQHRADRRRLADHRIGDAGEGGDVLRDRAARVHERGELRARPAITDPDRGELGDAGLLRQPARGLHVDDHEIDAREIGVSGRASRRGVNRLRVDRLRGSWLRGDWLREDWLRRS